MKKNDYHVILCQILTYLYDCLRNSEVPDKEHLKSFDIPIKYWELIFLGLLNNKYVTGVHLINRNSDPRKEKALWGDTPPQDRQVSIWDICIAPKGIEYLLENEFMIKTREMLDILAEWGVELKRD